MALIYRRKTRTGRVRWSVLIRCKGLPTEHKTFQAAHFAWWSEHLGHYRLCDLTPAVISMAKRKLLQGAGLPGRTLAGATVNRYLAALSRVLTVAVRELGWLESSPMPKVERSPESPGRVRFLSTEEQVALLSAARRAENPLVHPAIASALSTGGRRGEVLGLHWRAENRRSSFIEANTVY